MAKMGRPVFWDEDKKEFAIDSILERMAAGESCRAILDDGDRSVYPSYVTFCEWLNESEELVKHYTRAQEARAEKIFDEVLKIADSDEGFVDTFENIARDKLRLDARKWVLGRMAPKKYGDKLEVDAKVAATTTIVSLGSGINPDAATT